MQTGHPLVTVKGAKAWREVHLCLVAEFCIVVTSALGAGDLSQETLKAGRDQVPAWRNLERDGIGLEAEAG